MIRIVITITLSFAWFSSFAQINKYYFTIDGQESDSLSSYYYQKSTQISFTNAKTESFYSATGILRHKEDSVDEKGNSFRTYFYPHGTIKGKGHFIYSKPNGKFNSFYENGNKQGEFIFESKEELSIQIINYWDSLGNKIVENGNGKCDCRLNPYEDLVTMESGIVKDGLKFGQWKGEIKSEDVLFEETYKQGKLVNGVQNNKGEIFKYTKIEEMALPKEGIPGLMRYIGSSVKYPKSARRNGVQGTVFIAFVVEKDGSLREFKMLKGFDKECDDEALRVVSSLSKFNNGAYRGKPIKTRMVLPIKFKLG